MDERVAQYAVRLSRFLVILDHSAMVFSTSTASTLWKVPQVLSVFLDAFSHLYKRVCPSVGRSVTHELNF